MGKKKNKNRRFKNYSYNYRNQHFYDNFSINNIDYTVKSEQINKIALEVFGSLHFEINAQD